MSKSTSSDKRREKARASWGATVTSVEDIQDVFAKYIKGDIQQLPWTDSDKLQVRRLPSPHPTTSGLKFFFRGARCGQVLWPALM